MSCTRKKSQGDIKLEGLEVSDEQNKTRPMLWQSQSWSVYDTVYVRKYLF